MPIVIPISSDEPTLTREAVHKHLTNNQSQKMKDYILLYQDMSEVCCILETGEIYTKELPGKIIKTLLFKDKFVLVWPWIA